jgi:hypothetical protein
MLSLLTNIRRQMQSIVILPIVEQINLGPKVLDLPACALNNRV